MAAAKRSGVQRTGEGIVEPPQAHPSTRVPTIQTATSGIRVFRASRLAAIESRGERGDLIVRLKHRRSSIAAHPLAVGGRLLGAFGMDDTWLPQSGAWLPPHHASVITIADAFIFSSSGIVGLRSGAAIEETLDHTSTGIDGFGRLHAEPIRTADGGVREEGGLVLLPDGGRRLAGKYVSLLIGSHENYFHWLMSVARIGLLDREDLAGLAGLLIPNDLSATHQEAAEAAANRLGVPLHRVGRGQGCSVEQLVLPWNPLSVNGADDDAVAAVRNLFARQPPGRTRAIYIDRRHASARRLLNEEEVVRRLEREGVEPIDTSSLTLVEQAELFEGARLVIAPHGAGLTNIMFSGPGTRVIELMPSGTMNWCYRTLAASCGHRYDAVIGRSHLHHQTAEHEPWAVSVTHILSAMAEMAGGEG